MDQRYQTPYEQFRESLHDESPRSFYELESIRFGIMARLGLKECDALELAAKIVAGPRQKNTHQPTERKQDHGRQIF